MNYFNRITLFTLIVVLAAGCRKKDRLPGVTPINVIVKTSYETDGAPYSFPLQGISIKMTEMSNASVLSQQTDVNGLAVYNSIMPGTYNVDASITITKSEYESITGLSLDRDDVTFNASLANVTLNSTTNNTLELKLVLGKIGDWVLKQIYYAGSHTQNGAVFRDQFIEIYNNSNKVLYADSLYITQLSGSNTVSPDYSLGYFVNDGSSFQGQWDWSKSIGMTAGADAVTKYVYAKSLFRIPGTGTSYPVQPGASIVIAATAVNHKAPYTGALGTAIPINDPSLTVDLSDADFEIYLGNLISNPFNSDLDNPDVVNLSVIETGGNRDLILDNPGRDAIAIFKTNASFPFYNTTGTGDWPRYPSPNVTSITASTSLYYRIPNDVVIDAVQIQHVTPASRVPRKVSGVLDAGAIAVPGGQYSSQSVIRKTAKVVGGRKILKDTNNSTEDFTTLSRSLPGAFAE